MGVISEIAKIKGKFHKTRLKIISGKTAKLQEANLKEAELIKAKQEYREARQIRADLRADQQLQVKGEQPSKLKALGTGLQKHMNKAKEKKVQVQNAKPPMVGVPTSVQNQPSSTAQGGIFGGQRNLEVGGERDSPFKHKKGRDLF